SPEPTPHTARLTCGREPALRRLAGRRVLAGVDHGHVGVQDLDGHPVGIHAYRDLADARLTDIDADDVSGGPTPHVVPSVGSGCLAAMLLREAQDMGEQNSGAPASEGWRSQGSKPLTGNAFRRGY